MNNRLFIFESSISWIYRLIDLAMAMMVLLSTAYVFNVEWSHSYFILATITALLFLIISQAMGIYRSSHLRHSAIHFSKIFLPWLLAWMMVIIGLFLLKVSDSFSRLVIASWLILTPLLIVAIKLLFQKMIIMANKNFISSTRVAIVGVNSISEQLVDAISEVTSNVQIKSFYVHKQEEQSIESSIPIIGDIKVLIENAKNNHYDEVYLCLPLNEKETIEWLIEQFSDTTITVKYVPDMFSLELMHNKITDIGGMPVFSIYDTPLNSVFNQMVKRTEDLLLSTLILITISPLMLFLAIGVKLSSSGPIIFKQRRYGLNGKTINVYKFRSMSTMDDGEEVKQASKNDIRVTKYGKILRSFSLDEFPQFINVLQGKMSIVGPRPHAVAHNEEYRKIISKYMQRHMVKPGITGWAQINGLRGETEVQDKMEKRIEYDLHYIKNWSLGLDLKIILKTIFNIISDKNVY